MGKAKRYVEECENHVERKGYVYEISDFQAENLVIESHKYLRKKRTEQIEWWMRLPRWKRRIMLWLGYSPY